MSLGEGRVVAEGGRGRGGEGREGKGGDEILLLKTYS